MRHLLTAIALCLAAGEAGTLQQPVFRGGTDRVVVDARVAARRQPVDGLVASDFLVRDNGVEQSVTIASTGSVPLDLDLLVPQGLNGLSRLHFWADEPAVNALLRTGDRLGVTTIGSVAFEQLPLTPVPATAPARLEAFGGWPAVHNALAHALMRPSSAGRRHVILVLTVGESLADVITPTRLMDVARRSDAIVYVGHRPTILIDPDRALASVADLTGGAVFHEGGLVPALKQLLALLDHAYVLTYRPQGVSAGGWHQVLVSVSKPGSFTVRARQGYYGDEK